MPTETSPQNGTPQEPPKKEEGETSLYACEIGGKVLPLVYVLFKYPKTQGAYGYICALDGDLLKSVFERKTGWEYTDEYARTLSDDVIKSLSTKRRVAFGESDLLRDETGLLLEPGKDDLADIQQQCSQINCILADDSGDYVTEEPSEHDCLHAPDEGPYWKQQLRGGLKVLRRPEIQRQLAMGVCGLIVGIAIGYRPRF